MAAFAGGGAIALVGALVLSLVFERGEEADEAPVTASVEAPVGAPATEETGVAAVPGVGEAGPADDAGSAEGGASGSDVEVALADDGAEAADGAAPATPDAGDEAATAEPETAPSGAPEGDASQADEPAGDAAAETAGSAETAGEEEAPVSAAPVFDLVRVEPDGSGLAAGRAEPSAEIEIVIDGAVVGETTAGPDGAFVAFFQTPPPAPAAPAPPEDDAATRVAGAPEAPPAAPATAPATAPGALAVTARVRVEDAAGLAAAAEGGPADGRPEGGAPAEGGGAVSVPVFILSAADPGADTAAAPVIVRPEEDGVRIVQAAPAAAGALTLDAISYDAGGRAVFAGRAPAEGEVRLYLDGALVGGTEVSDDGSWRAQAADDIRPGVYTLRLDQVDAAGAVTSRIETPFQRETIAKARLGPGAVTIQRGDNLWRIAENHYGSGVRYTVIYGANRAKIRDPDLIYPGQVFTIPEDAPRE